MIRLKTLGVVLAAIAVATSGIAFAGYGEKGDIPVTTSSEAAQWEFYAGRAAADRGDATEARNLFARAVEIDPDFAHAWLQHANNTASFQAFNDSLQKAAEAAERGKVSDGEKILIEMGKTFIDNNADRRIELAQKLVDKYPDGYRAHINAAFAYGGVNQHEKARKHAKRAAEIAPNEALAYSSLGFSYLFNEPKDFDKAAKYFKKTVKLNPGEDNFHMNLGDAHRAMNKLDASQADYTRALTLDPQNSIAATKRGHINSFLGNYDEARADYDRGIAAATEGTKAQLANYKIFTWVHAGELDEAVKQFDALYRDIGTMDMPDDQRTSTRLFTLTNEATLCLHSDMLDKAESAISSAAKVLRKQAEVMGQEPVTRRNEAAIAYWEGQLAARKGEFRTANKLAKKNAKLLEPDQNPRKMENYHDLMGLVAMMQENYPKAVEHYEQADLTRIYVKYHLAQALEGAGKKDAARDKFREVGEWNFNSIGYALVRKDALERSGAVRVSQTN